MLREFFYVCLFIAIWTVSPDVFFNVHKHLSAAAINFLLGFTVFVYPVYIVIINFSNDRRMAAFFPRTTRVTCSRETKAGWFVVMAGVFSILPSALFYGDGFHAAAAALPFLLALYLERRSGFKGTKTLLCILTGQYTLTEE